MDRDLSLLQPNAKRQKRTHLPVQRDFDCCLCLHLLCKPVSIPCGHTFCRSCLIEAQRNQILTCPVCRAPCTLHASSIPVNILIQNVIAKMFPDEYAHRLEEATSHEERSERQLSLLCSGFRALFPYQKVHMILAQERSLIMLERCLQGDRKFGYMTKTAPAVGALGTIAEIQECTRQADGRMHVVVKGVKMFRVTKHWVEADSKGLYSASVEFVDDTDDASCSGTESTSYLNDSNWEYVDQFNAYCEEHRNIPTMELASRASSLLSLMMKKLDQDKEQTFFRVFGQMPDLSRQSLKQFSYWLANVVGMSDTMRERMLNATSVRMKIGLALFKLECVYTDESAQESAKPEGSSENLVSTRAEIRAAE